MKKLESLGAVTHTHDNMEIISIPLSGTLEHSDSLGNRGTIEPNEIQVMSAGTGVKHSEYNASEVDPVEFLQIWVLPNERDVTPSYDQIQIDPADRKNKLQQIVSPNPEDAGTWIHQKAWFHLADLEQGKEISYTLQNRKNGVYIFLLEGQLDILGEVLERRDALAVMDITEVSFIAREDASILLIEVPLVI